MALFRGGRQLKEGHVSKRHRHDVPSASGGARAALHGGARKGGRGAHTHTLPLPGDLETPHPTPHPTAE